MNQWIEIEYKLSRATVVKRYTGTPEDLQKLYVLLVAYVPLHHAYEYIKFKFSDGTEININVKDVLTFGIFCEQKEEAANA